MLPSAWPLLLVSVVVALVGLGSAYLGVTLFLYHWTVVSALLVCWAVAAVRFEVVVVGLMKGDGFGGLMYRFSVCVEWCACALL